MVTITDRPRSGTYRYMRSWDKTLLAFQGALVLGGYADVVVALVRWAGHRRGAQLGPFLVSLVLAAGAPVVGRWAVRHQGRPAGALLVGYGSAVLLAPAAAAPVRATLVGRGHPMWQLALTGGARVLSAVVLLLPSALRVERRRRAAELSGA